VTGNLRGWLPDVKCQTALSGRKPATCHPKLCIYTPPGDDNPVAEN
jgi:hypothetical protein